MFLLLKRVLHRRSILVKKEDLAERLILLLRNLMKMMKKSILRKNLAERNLLNPENMKKNMKRKKMLTYMILWMILMNMRMKKMTM